MIRRIVTGDEQDAYTAGRKLYCYLQRPGAVKAIKARTHRRERREAQAEINAQIVDHRGNPEIGCCDCVCHGWHEEGCCFTCDNDYSNLCSKGKES